MDLKKIFHYISYLQYPLMFSSTYFIVLMYMDLKSLDNIINQANNLMVVLGLGISFSTLQDTTTTQNEFSKKIWQDPKKGKAFIVFFGIFSFGLIFSGVLSLFLTSSSALIELSTGIFVLGIGLLGMLKAALEMFENYRLDKNEN